MSEIQKAWSIARQVRTWRPQREMSAASIAGWRRDQFKAGLRKAGISWAMLPHSDYQAMLSEVSGDIRTNPRR
jgi:hypothetical protein